MSVQMSGSRGAADAPDEEGAERDDEQPLLAEPVAELAEDRREHGCRQQEPVITHVTHVVVASSSRWSSGSAGTTIVCWSA